MTFLALVLVGALLISSVYAQQCEMIKRHFSVIRSDCLSDTCGSATCLASSPLVMNCFDKQVTNLTCDFPTDVTTM